MNIDPNYSEPPYAELACVVLMILLLLMMRC